MITGGALQTNWATPGKKLRWSVAERRFSRLTNWAEWRYLCGCVFQHISTEAGRILYLYRKYANNMGVVLKLPPEVWGHEVQGDFTVSLGSRKLIHTAAHHQNLSAPLLVLFHDCREVEVKNCGRYSCHFAKGCFGVSHFEDWQENCRHAASCWR